MRQSKLVCVCEGRLFGFAGLHGSGKFLLQPEGKQRKCKNGETGAAAAALIDLLGHRCVDLSTY